MARRNVSPNESRDDELVSALRRGDETAFLELVNRHHPAMVRIARCHVSTDAAAEEVAQDAWIGMLEGLDRFEGRCSLRAWLFSILCNRARTRSARDWRVVPFSALEDEGDDGGEPDLFQRGPSCGEGRWAERPRPIPEEALLTREAARLVREAIEGLPASQRQVITLRDVEQWSGEEVCAALGLTEANQRVLLHRARSRVRAALEERFGERPSAARAAFVPQLCGIS